MLRGVTRAHETIRALAPGDEAALERFLSRHADGSMFLRSNSRTAGLRDEGERLQGSYVAAFDAAGEVVGAAAHYRNHILVLQAPGAAGELARSAASESGRDVGGLVGPWSQVVEARTALGLDHRRTSLESTEDLYALELDELRVPPALADGRLVVCRAPAGDAELAQARAWRVAYHVEALGSLAGPELDRAARDEIETTVARGELWLLVDRERGMLSMTALNARLPDVVQVGGVYTPPELRGRGHARAVVAGQLAALRGSGARRAVLFTERQNRPARRAYEALGFRVVGDYGLILFEP